MHQDNNFKKKHIISWYLMYSSWELIYHHLWKVQYFWVDEFPGLPRIDREPNGGQGQSPWKGDTWKQRLPRKNRAHLTMPRVPFFTMISPCTDLHGGSENSPKVRVLKVGRHDSVIRSYINPRGRCQPSKCKMYLNVSSYPSNRDVKCL